MKPEKENLIRDLLDADSGRDETLLAAGGILRRRRHLRIAVRGVTALAAIAFLAVFSLKRNSSQPSSALVISVRTKASPAPQVQALTDEQLLSMFPSNTPVGIVSLVDGKKRLIFPRAGDEDRFVTRL